MRLAGKTIGIVLTILGLILSIILIIVLPDANSLAKILIAGPALVTIGIAMIIFPGGNITTAELNAQTKPSSVIWSDAPLLHKIVWIVAGALGIAIAFYLLISQGFM